MKKLILWIIVVSIFGAIVFFVSQQFSKKTEISKPEQNTQQNETSTTSGTTKEKQFTMSDVSNHNNRESCYTAIRGSVYDLTQWIDQHPGGPDAILSICGKDGTDAFVAQHGGRPRQEQELETFKIGTLAQ